MLVRFTLLRAQSLSVGVFVHEFNTDQDLLTAESSASAPGWRRLMGPLLLLVLLIVMGRFGGHYWSGIQVQVEGMGTKGLVLYWVVMVLLSIACFPVSVMGFSAGAMYGWWIGLGLLLSGGLVSGMAMFWLGKGLLYETVQAYIKPRPRLAQLDRLAKVNALRLNVLTRLSPLNYGLASYVLAAGKPSWGQYSWGLLAILPSSVAWVWMGHLAKQAGGAADQGHSTPWWLIGTGMVFFGLLFWQVGRMAKQAMALDGGPTRSGPAADAETGEIGFWETTKSTGDIVRTGKSNWEWDLAKGKLKVSREFLKQLGYENHPTTIAEAWVTERIHPNDLPRVRESVAANLRRHDPTLAVEFRFLRTDGVYIWLQVMALAIWNQQGKTRSLLGTLLDVTDRVVIAEERDRLFNLSPDLLASCDFQGNLQQVNPAWVRVLGWSRDDLITRPLSEFVDENDKKAVANMLETLAGGQTVDGLETRWRMRSGGVCWLSWNCFPYEGDKRFFAVVRDISRRKAAEEKVLVYQDQLRKLSYQLSLVEDRQRRQLATALHDGLAQLLFATRAQITLLKFPEKISDPQPIIQKALDLLDETMTETRSLSFQLFPPALTDVGLTAALHWLAKQFDQHRGLLVTVNSTGAEPDLPQDVRSLLFQCARELLTNVVKHARVDRAQIFIDFSETAIQLTIRDDGAGDAKLEKEPETGSSEESGFGLFSIRERLLAVNGSMNIRSNLGQGTTVGLTLPLMCGTGDILWEKNSDG